MSLPRNQRGRAVLRISLPWMIDVVQAVDNLSQVTKGNTYGQIWGFAYTARNQLEALFVQSLYGGSLHSSRQSANQLHQTLSRVVEADMADAVTDIDDWQIGHQREQFRTVFLAELGTLPCYFVAAKPPYDTDTLLDGGEALMPADLSQKVPEAAFDAKEAAKALAYELGTACGFHAFRLLESVVRRYYKEVTGGAAPPKQRNLGVYIRALTTAKANTKVVAALTQLKDLHRNPLAHPEVALLVDEAISILGMVRSAVAAMLNELPHPPTTTSTID